MQANWSIILNVLLLIGVIVAIARLMQSRRDNLNPQRYQPSTGQNPGDAPAFQDDIIAVRKVTRDSDIVNEESLQPKLGTKPTLKTKSPSLMAADEPAVSVKIDPQVSTCTRSVSSTVRQEYQEQPLENPSIMFFLLAKDNRQFAGYELLQTVLAAGLRFGEGQIFHRHQFASGQGPVLCSLAAATASGVFDLQNIGAFSVRGLCLFMQASNNPSIDAERFSIMLDTAKQLCEGLDAHLLDDQRKPLTDERMVRYYRALRIDMDEVCTA